MLDVHAPHEKVHGVGDFLLHILTITVGLLIALGLEATVEAIHHRHQREQAEATIRREITDNRQKLKKMQSNTKIEIDNLLLALAFTQDLRSGKKDDPRAIKLGFNVEPLQDAGWTTASATGALSYMDYDEVQRFATAYHEQANYEAAVAQALSQYEVLDTYISNDADPRDMKPQDIETAIPDLRKALADLSSMADWARGTMGTYNDALKQ
jgi:uncharacterized membrane protein